LPSDSGVPKYSIQSDKLNQRADLQGLSSLAALACSPLADEIASRYHFIFNFHKATNFRRLGFYLGAFMQIIKPNSNFDFIGKNRIAVILSLVMILTGFLSLALKGGPRYGVDFSGGLLVQVRFSVPIEPDRINDLLSGLKMESVTVQQFGDSSNEFLIRSQHVPEDMAHFAEKVERVLKVGSGDEKIEILRREMVGPQVGKDLRIKGVKALLYAMAGVLIYICFRFEYRFGIAAMVALAHDVLVTLAFLSIFGKEIDLTVIAALLAIIGYSINDTIIIFDRIRENIRRHDDESLPIIVNRSINETMSRTILTSGTTLMVVLSLFFLGGDVINGFAFTLLVGIIAGTFSSVFVAGALILFWEKHRPKMSKRPVAEIG
jgi:preprotein translocase subunit SecF